MTEIGSAQSIAGITPPAQETEAPALPALAGEQPAVRGRITVRRILEVTAKHFRTTPVDLVSRCRKQPLVRRRQIAMYIAREKTGRSLPFIGQIMGDRDHTTVLHGVRAVQGLIDAGDGETIAAVDRIVEQLQVTVSEPPAPTTSQTGMPA
jgi:chromosomal replication initiation ATPase DnaA